MARADTTALLEATSGRERYREEKRRQQMLTFDTDRHHDVSLCRRWTFELNPRGRRRRCAVYHRCVIPFDRTRMKFSERALDRSLVDSNVKPIRRLVISKYALGVEPLKSIDLLRTRKRTDKLGVAIIAGS